MNSSFSARVLTGGISLVSHMLMTRDRIFGRVDRIPQDPSREEFFITSGGRRLAAVWVAGPQGAPAILLCHGIGETVEHWGAVQLYLRQRGVSSLICNYSGYGKSEGRISPEHCDEDFVAAYAELRRRVESDARVYVVGFSMGSGVAASGVGKLVPAPDGLFLCAAFSSFRGAMRAMWVPGWLTQWLPNIWDTVEAVRTLRLPVCVMHSDTDEMLPVEMARKIASACGGDLVIVHGLRHVDPYLRPTDVYWGALLERVRGR
ncbi:MAG: alpha/beta fold hydrolase [Acidobacteriota bacterium]|nr:alpha/beta fold hydrolase [Acidobacteriota bacterium]